MERDINSVEGCKVKNLLKILLALILCALVSSCGLLCQAGTGTCGMSSEDAHKLLHPKPYRDYWSKPAMTDEGRKADWVACGGSENGNFSWDSRRMLPGETNETSRLRQSSELKACLTPRGYHHEIARD